MLSSSCYKRCIAYFRL